jgi:hypothetical protein
MGGSSPVLTAILKGVDLVAMGYKYDKRKVIHFIATAGACNTFGGDDPYMQRWADEYGNINVELFRDQPLLPSIFP